MAASSAVDIPDSKIDYCPCNRCNVARKQGKQEVKERVREILKEVTADKSETGLSRSEHLVVVALADRIYQSLDGEQ